MTAALIWTVVIDDDPTGSQVVNGIEAVFGTDPAEVLHGLRTGGGRCFVLTNSRSLPGAEAVAAAESVATTVLQAVPDGRVRFVSRGDSTLRGHVYAEVEALQRIREQLLGRRHDVVLFVPAFPQAGRTTLAGVHRARIDGVDVPVAETEFARDATFGYSTSRMSDFVEEATGGRVRATDVLHIDLADVHEGAARVAELLATAIGRWVTADALTQADVDTLAAGARLREEAGDSIVYRAGPALVPSLLGIVGEHVVGPDELATPPGAEAHGIVVVGSHTALTTRQVEVAVEQHAPALVEFDVPGYLAAIDRECILEELADEVATTMRARTVVLMTSRARVDGADAETSLALARDVSAGVSGLVRRIVSRATPRWVVLKGGITSHDGALHGLEASRARILGQVRPGHIGVFRAETGPLAGGSFVVFPGNVGTESALADTIALLDRAQARPQTPHRESEGD